MEFGDVRNLQFLDLSGVEDNERAKVVASLQLDRPEPKFPWFIGHGKQKTGARKKTPKKTTQPPPVTLPPTQNIPVPPKTNPIYQPKPFPVVKNTIPIVSPIPGAVLRNIPHVTAINIANTAPSSPVFTTYPPQYVGTPVSTVFQRVYVATYPSPVNSFSQNGGMQFVSSPQPILHPFPSNTVVPPVNGTVLNSTTEVSGQKPVPEHFDNSQTSQEQNSPGNDGVSQSETPVSGNTLDQSQSVQNTDEKQDTKPNCSGRKSWASLFNAGKGPDTNQGVNGMVPPAFNQAVNEVALNGDAVCPIKNPRKAPFIDPECYRMGEFLISYVMDGRSNSLQPRGLVNRSNYCYINSILQALIACPPVYNLLNGLSHIISSHEKQKPTPVIDGMVRFARGFNHLPADLRVNNRRSDGKNQQQKKDQGASINTDVPFEPLWIYQMLKGIRSDLIEGRQEDAEEFLGCLLNNLNDEMLELIKLVKNDVATREAPKPVQNHSSSDSEDKEWQMMGPKNKSSVTRRHEFDRTPISDIFGGFLRSRIHRAGDRITENIQPFFTLPLNIEKVNTVREALEALATKYQLEGVTSSKTNEEVEAWQQVMLDELPVILVLHLKCFDFKLDGCTKIVKALEFPIDLKIDSKLLSSKTIAPKEKHYKLFAVVYHDGEEATKGHYVTDAFHVGYGSWLRYDDASVKRVQEDQVLNPQGTRVPYLLFYRRSDTIRSR